MRLPTFSPLKLFAPAPPRPALAGAGMGGSILFASGSGSGTGGGPDDDDDFGFDEGLGGSQETPAEPRQRPQRTARAGGGDTNGRRRTVQFEPEERYWTDYLRIALPVIGLLLMIGLLWFWAQQIISDDPDTTEPNPTEEIGLVTTITPAPTNEPAESTPPANTGETSQNTGNTTGTTGQQAERTPTANQGNEQTTGGDNQSGANQEDTPAPTEEAAAGGEIAVDTQVTVTEALNMRDAPNTAGNLVVELPAGAVLDVIGGPEEGETYVWWNVVDADGNSGWVVQDYIEPAQ